MTKYDIVIFGASGFTGQFVVEHLARTMRESDQQGMTWAVSGRSESKLKSVLDTAASTTGLDEIRSIPVIIADTSDFESLVAMASQTKMVINCVGPYRFFGEQVVKACVQAGANHVDISGEPMYLEKMQLKYNDEAAQKGIYIIGACGFDSIPADVGQMYLTEHMEGDVNSIETYLEVTTPPNVPGPIINFATYQSAIHGVATADQLKPLRRKLFPERMPKTNPKVPARGVVHWSNVVDGYCMPFMGSDKSVMARTQRALYTNDKKRPAQLQCYARMSSAFYCFLAIVAGIIFGLLAKFSLGRSLLEAFPGVFSFGTVSKKGPSKEMAEETNFVMTLVGTGWSTTSDESEPAADRPDDPDRRVMVTVSGKNIGYGSTCTCLVQAALTVLQEADRLPGKGGVFPPGYAFRNTSLVKRLNFHEVVFTADVEPIKK